MEDKKYDEVWDEIYNIFYEYFSRNKDSLYYQSKKKTIDVLKKRFKGSMIGDDKK